MAETDSEDEEAEDAVAGQNEISNTEIPSCTEMILSNDLKYLNRLSPLLQTELTI